MKSICVCLSGVVAPKKYAKPAREFACLMASRGYGLVWGGSNVGLMKIVCSTIQEHGGHLCGITIELFKGSCKTDAHEMVIAPDLSARKKLMLERSDAIVVMAGGIGTIDEATEVLELKKDGTHQKPIVFLNTDNFFEGLLLQYERAKQEGFLTKALADLVYVASTPIDAIGYIDRELHTF